MAKSNAAARAAADPDFGGIVPRRRWPMHVIVPVVVTLVVGGVMLVSAGRAIRPATPVRVLPVVYDRAPAEQPADTSQDARGRKTVQASGWLEADPFSIACTALADGVVAEMLVLEGQGVEKGQVVARLVADDAHLALARAEADVGVAKAEVEVAEAELAAARTDWDNPVERDRAVDVSVASLAETESELAQLPSLIEAEQAMYESTREELTRLQASFESGAASDIEVIILEKDAEARGASVEALRKREAILVARRDRLRAETEAARRNADLRVEERRALAIANAKLARATAAMTQAEAMRDEAQLRLDRMEIVSPITGLVQQRLKSPGDKVMLAMDDPHSSHLVHLYDPEKLQVRVDVPLADASNVFVGQRCEVVVDVLPDRTFPGEVTRITNEADVQKNTLQVKVRVIEPSELLRPEMLTRVKFIGSSGSTDAGAQGSETIVLVPEESIDASGDAPHVWVVRHRRAGRGVVEPVPVREIGRDAGWARVAAALVPGDLLAIDAPDLEPGRHVRLIGDGGES